MIELAFTGGRGNEGLSALLGAFLCQHPAIYADCSMEETRLKRILKLTDISDFPMSHISRFTVKEDLCNHCFQCLGICQQHALEANGNVLVFNEYRCTSCGSCIRWCPACALSLEEHQEAGIHTAKSRLGTVTWSDSVIDSFYHGEIVNAIRSRARILGTPENHVPVFIRVGRGFGPAAFSAARQVSGMVLITAPAPYAVSDLRAMIRFSRLQGIEPIVILNQSGRSGMLEIALLDLINHEKVFLAGKIPYSRDFIRAEHELLTLPEFAPQSEVIESLSQTLENILQHVQSQSIL